MNSVVENKLPIDWSIKQIGQVGDIVTGNTPSKKNSDYWSEKSEYMFVKPPNLGTGNIVLSTNEMLTKEGFEKAKPIAKNSIMICCIGSLGKIGIAGKELATNQQINSILFYKEIVEFKFGYYFALTLKSHMHKIANKAIVQIINKTSFSKIEIPIPPLEEQKRIVAKIDGLFAEIDKAISLTEESLVQAKNLLPSVLKELFEKGKADGWEEKKLGEVIEKTKNVNPKTSSFDEFTYIDISAVDKSLQEIVLPKTVKSIGAPSRAKKSIELDDILFATTRPNLKNIAIVSVLYEFPIASTGFCVVRSNSETHNRYLFYYLISDLLQEQIEPYIRGAQYPAISDKDLKSVLIPVPNLKEQIQLSELFDKISEESKKTQSKLEEQLAYLKQLKSSILTKAFKGEL